jgi:peptidoglycan hydrolase-like protein with peptidoglycan-binding domain
MTRIKFGLVVIAVLLVTAGTVPALAHSQTSGSIHAFGDMVAYEMVFPVQGDTYYFDSFWASRADGIHHAQDLMSDKMTPVVAVADGTIRYVNWSSNPNDLRPSRCCTLEIRHDDGWSSKYIHLNNDTPGTDDGQAWGIAEGILPGVRVSAGQLIGWVGDSGNAEGTDPHLHFELEDPEGTLVNAYESLKAAESGTPITITITPPATAAACDTLGPDDAQKLLNRTKPLRKGGKGAAVRQLQTFLDELGYPVGTIDAKFGKSTKKAVRQFQRDHGLTVDGIVGAGTRAEIATILEMIQYAGVLQSEARGLRPGANGEDVAQLQHLLEIAGYDPGTPDGAYGDLTSAAVTDFQTDHDIKTDGKVGPKTRVALAEYLGVDADAICQ